MTSTQHTALVEHTQRLRVDRPTPAAPVQFEVRVDAGDVPGSTLVADPLTLRHSLPRPHTDAAIRVVPVVREDTATVVNADTLTSAPTQDAATSAVHRSRCGRIHRVVPCDVDTGVEAAPSRAVTRRDRPSRRALPITPRGQRRPLILLATNPRHQRINSASHRVTEQHPRAAPLAHRGSDAVSQRRQNQISGSSQPTAHPTSDRVPRPGQPVAAHRCHSLRRVTPSSGTAFPSRQVPTLGKGSGSLGGGVDAGRVGEVHQLRTLFTHNRPTTGVAATLSELRYLSVSRQAGANPDSRGHVVEHPGDAVIPHGLNDPVDRVAELIRNLPPGTVHAVNRVTDPARDVLHTAPETLDHIVVDPLPHGLEGALDRIPRRLHVVNTVGEEVLYVLPGVLEPVHDRGLNVVPHPPQRVPQVAKGVADLVRVASEYGPDQRPRLTEHLEDVVVDPVPHRLEIVIPDAGESLRSEERRVGKECRSRRGGWEYVRRVGN